MGLFDSYNNANVNGLFSPLNMGLFGLSQGFAKAGAPSPYPVSTLAALNQGLAGGVQGLMQGAQMEQQRKLAEANLELLGARKGVYEAQGAAAKEKAARAARVAALIADAQRVPGISDSSAQAINAPWAARSAQTPADPQSVYMDVSKKLASEGLIDEAKSIAGLASTYGDSFPVDRGSFIELRSKSDPKQIISVIPKSMTPGESANLDFKRTEYNFPSAADSERLRQGRQQQSREDANLYFTTGMLPGAFNGGGLGGGGLPMAPRPMSAAPAPAAAAPSVPAPMTGMTPKAQAERAAKITAERPDAQLHTQMQLDDIRRLRTLANEIANDPALGRSTGIRGAFPSVPGSAAANVDALIGSLKAQVSGMKLQAMRNASKTGGAVGQVTEREWPRLENMITALDKVKMNESQFKTKLNELMNEMDRIAASTTAAFEGQYGPMDKPATSDSSSSSLPNGVTVTRVK